MGSEGYIWVTRYRKNLAEALERARNEVFLSGKFIGAELYPATFQEAWAHDPEGGTGSLLDIVSVGGPDDFCSVYPLSVAELLSFFGTERPALDEIRNCTEFWESFDRGQARAISLYENGRPAKICFAGWTIDTGAAGDGSYEDASSRKIQARFARMMKEKAKKEPSAPPAEQIPAGDRMSDLASVMKVLAETRALSKRMSEPPSSEQWSDALWSDALGKIRILETLLNRHDDDLSFFEELAKRRPEMEKMAQECLAREGFSDDSCKENQASPRHETPPAQNPAERGNTVRKPLTRQYQKFLIYTQGFLKSPAQEILCKTKKLFPERFGWICGTLNQNRDFYILLPPRSLDYTPEDDEKNAVLRDFYRKFGRNHSWFIDHQSLKFPYEGFLIEIQTVNGEGDSMNQTFLKVSSSGDFTPGNPISATLKFKPRTHYLAEGETADFTSALEKSEKIVSDWFFEASSVGIFGNMISSDNFYIETSINSLKFQITCEKPVDLPLIELYLRLRAGLNAEERYGILTFVGKKKRKVK